MRRWLFTAEFLLSLAPFALVTYIAIQAQRAGCDLFERGGLQDLIDAPKPWHVNSMWYVAAAFATLPVAYIAREIILKRPEGRPGLCRTCGHRLRGEVGLVCPACKTVIPRGAELSWRPGDANVVPAFRVGQGVRVVFSDRNPAPFAGTVRRITWRPEDHRYHYDLEVGGMKVRKHYFDEELEPAAEVCQPVSIREGLVLAGVCS